jgi:hypothetical protein
VTRFEFAFSRPLSWPLALVGVTPWTAHVDVTDDELAVRFGPWSLVTPLSNVDGAEVTGPYLPFKVFGPHISLADRGVTFGTTWRRGVCVRFREPVPAALPGPLLRHPAVTVTIADADRLAAALQRRSGDDAGAEVGHVLRPVPDDAGLAEVTATSDAVAAAPAPVSRRPLKRTTTRTTRPATPSPAPTAEPTDEAGETQSVAGLSPRRSRRQAAATSTATSTATSRGATTTSTAARRPAPRSPRTTEPEHPTPADMPKHTSTEKAPGVTPPADEDLPGPDQPTP